METKQEAANKPFKNKKSTALLPFAFSERSNFHNTAWGDEDRHRKVVDVDSRLHSRLIASPRGDSSEAQSKLSKSLRRLRALEIPRP